MKIVYSGSREVVSIAVDDSNFILNFDEFYTAIEAHPGFDPRYTDPAYTPKKIANLLRTSTLDFEIKLYKSRWPWSKANAYTTAQYPNTLFLNTRRLNRPVESIVNTIIHESIHALDNAIDPTKRLFHHGDNSPVGKENTAAYWIGNLAENLGEDGSNDSFSLVDKFPVIIEELENIADDEIVV